MARQTSFFVDTNIVSAIEVFFIHAIRPGSCTEYLLRGDYDRAKLSAHPLIKDTEKKWQEHVNYIEDAVPMCCRGDNYDTWIGFKNLSKEEQDELRMLLVLEVGFPVMNKWCNTLLEDHKRYA